MPTRAKVDQLPDGVRKELEQRLIKGGFGGYRDLSQWLTDQGFEISKSSLHNWGQNFEDRVAALKRVTAQARAIVSESPDDDGAVNDALIRLVQEKAYTALMDMEIDPKKIELPKLMRVIADLGRAAVSQKRLVADMRKLDAEKLDAAVAAGEIDVEAAERARRIMGFE